MINYEEKYKWNKTSLTYGKYIGNFFYWSKPTKRFSLLWRPNDPKDAYGETWKSYHSVRAAEQAMKNMPFKSRFTLVDELTKHISHYNTEVHL